MNRLRPCWAPIGTRPEVAAQLIRERIYLYGAVSPKDGTCVYLIMPTSNPQHASRPFSTRTGAQVCPTRHLAGARRRAQSSAATLPFLTTSRSCIFRPIPRNSIRRKTSGMNSAEKISQELCPQIHGRSAHAKLRQAILYIERNPKLVRSITSFPYIVNSL